MNFRRQSGILLHPTSLPGSAGMGSFGSAAREFVDFLCSAGQTLWQVLPLGPTGFGNCPYSCYSAFAGNQLLVDLELLVSEGDLKQSEINAELPGNFVDYNLVESFKIPLLRTAARRFLEGGDSERKLDFWRFCDTTFWLHDFALFMSCKEHFAGKPWSKWPQEISRRTADGFEKYSKKLGQAIGEHKYIQWQFFRQWDALRSYANTRGVKIIGDAPIFVAYDSADVWCNRHLFHLDENGKPVVVAGVPPDYFSKTGQLWGNPLYNWSRMAEDGFAWWVARMRNDIRLYDLVRIDHFRGLDACWAVKYGERTAIKGEWVKSPGESLLNAFQLAFGSLPIIAEDLGVITHEVESLRDWFMLPGMKILQFAFGDGAENPYLPHNYTQNCVVYTGTHDNNTTAGWFAGLDGFQRDRVLRYLRCCDDEIVREMIRAAFASSGRMAIIPMQDLLGLDATARMNVPGVAKGNWSWRLENWMVKESDIVWLRELTEFYNRHMP